MKIGVAARQTLLMYAALAASLLFGVAVSALNARQLGPEGFGAFKFVQVVWTLTTVASTFGLLSTCGNMVARSSEKKSSELIGAGLVLAIAEGVLLSLVLFIAAPLLEPWADAGVVDRIGLFAPFVGVFLVQILLQEVLRGANAIGTLVVLTVLPQLAYLICAGGWSFNHKLTIDQALSISLLSIGSSCAISVYLVRPSFRKLNVRVAGISRQNGLLGFPIYLAVLVTNASTQISQLLVAFQLNAKALGAYSLAVTLSMPLAMLPSAIGTTRFKAFASSKGINQRLMWILFASAFLPFVLFVLAIPVLVDLIYSSQYRGVSMLAVICGVGSAMRGVGDVFNRFLLANRQSRALRNNSFVLGALAVIASALLIDLFDIKGAAVAKVLVDLLYLCSMVAHYLINVRAEK